MLLKKEKPTTTSSNNNRNIYIIMVQQLTFDIYIYGLSHFFAMIFYYYQYKLFVKCHVYSNRLLYSKFPCIIFD